MRKADFSHKEHQVSYVALTRKYVYWTYYGRAQQPMRRALLGRLFDAEDVAPSDDQPNSVHATQGEDGVLYTLATAATEAPAGHVMRRTDEGEAELIAERQFEPGLPLEVDGVVYWVEFVSGTGLINKVPGASPSRIRFGRPGGPIETLEDFRDFSGWTIFGDTVCAVDIVRAQFTVGRIGHPVTRVDADVILGDPVAGPGGRLYAPAAPKRFEPWDRIVAISASGVEPILNDLPGLGEVAGDATHLYWFASEGLFRWAPGDAKPELIQKPWGRNEYALTVGATAVAWAASRGRESTLLVLPKEL